MQKYLTSSHKELFFKFLIGFNLLVNLPLIANSVQELPSTPPSPEMKISVKNITLPGANKNYYRVGDIIEISVTNFPSKVTPAKPLNPKSLLLYINGLPMQGLHPNSGPLLSKDGQNTTKLTFLLDRNIKTKDNTDIANISFADSISKAWDRFYRYPREKESPVSFSVGTYHQELTPRVFEQPQGKRIILELVKEDRLWLIWLATAVTALLLGWLAVKYNILKESKFPFNNLYSLSRVQIGWWTVIILGSFLHLYIYTGEFNDLTTTTMTLLGLSGATLLGASIIDSNTSQLTSDNTLQPKPFESRGFLIDILSDGKGDVNVQRFQFLVWTLALTFIFIRGVVRDLSMPEFGTNLLLLMGISNSIYLLLKIPENKSTNPLQTAVTPSPIAQSVPSGTLNTSMVAADGNVLSRQEDDMGPSILSNGGANNLPNSNQSLG